MDEADPEDAGSTADGQDQPGDSGGPGLPDGSDRPRDQDAAGAGGGGGVPGADAGGSAGADATGGVDTRGSGVPGPPLPQSTEQEKSDGGCTAVNGSGPGRDAAIPTLLLLFAGLWGLRRTD